MWSVAVRLLTKFLFTQPVIQLKHCGVREHMHKHNKLWRTAVPIKGLTYSLAYFSSDIIIGVQISHIDRFMMFNELIVVWYSDWLYTMEAIAKD